jgi:LysM repeat protein
VFSPKSWFQRLDLRAIVNRASYRYRWISISVIGGIVCAFLLFAAPVQADKGHGGGFIWYRVQSGDTLSALAQRYHTSIRALRKANRLKSTLIRRGQKLKIPVVSTSRPCGKTYRVRRGDTLRTIAKHCQVSVKQIKQWNGLKKNSLRVGQKLRVSLASVTTVDDQPFLLPSSIDLYQRVLPTPTLP